MKHWDSDRAWARAAMGVLISTTLASLWGLGALLSCNAPSSISPSTTDVARQDERHAMVREQLVARGITADRVLTAMERVPRHRFVPASLSSLAYADRPLSIGHGQTISQPFVVAYMIQALRLEPQDRVLEIGTGSGYQAAILAELVAHVFTMEIVAPLAERAGSTLHDLGYRNVTIRVADGSEGWPEEAPFDAIITSAAAEELPDALLEQLARGGRLVIPVGKEEQRLMLYRRMREGYESADLGPVAFVPLVQGELP